jgi:2-polyprenyl-3-methyl-5-hydroxy-6-metoxy-1,4-benzoquinol methylase
MTEHFLSQQQVPLASSDCGPTLTAAVRRLPEILRTRQPIHELCRGLDVLVVGALGGYKDRRPNSKWEQEWEFYKLEKLCHTIVGIDIDSELVRLASSEDGHDIRLANAETFNLNAEFDVIYATHVIEHLDRPGSLLIQSFKHLRRGGLLIVETPNPFGINVAIGVLFNLNYA